MIYNVENDILLSAGSSYIIGLCDHKFCQSCFRQKNRFPFIFDCPCCRIFIYDRSESIDEAILLGEVATLSNYISPYLLSETDTVMAVEDIIRIDEMNMSVITKLETALRLNYFNFFTLYSLFRTCGNGQKFFNTHRPDLMPSSGYYRYVVMQFGYANKLIDFPFIPEVYAHVRSECFYTLASTLSTYRNYPAALKYAKLAYEHCLRSSDHTKLTTYKGVYLFSRIEFAKLPPLRFAVGDEVEFLHELETGSEWKRGKVVELYYRDVLLTSISVLPIACSSSTTLTRSTSLLSTPGSKLISTAMSVRWASGR